MRDLLELHRTYRKVFDSQDGMSILEDLEARGCFERSSFSSEPGRTDFNEGRRSMVLHIKHMKDEDNFINLMEDYNG